jgi:hypothetical protein
MGVSIYNWGQGSGGSGSSGTPAAPAAAPYGPPDQFEGTLAGATTITFTRSTKRITIRNTDDSNSLEYSLDGSTWFAIGAYGSISEPFQVASLQLRPVAGTPTYEVVAVLSS